MTSLCNHYIISPVVCTFAVVKMASNENSFVSERSQAYILGNNNLKCIFNPKNFEVKENCSKTLLNACPLKCTYIGKKSFQFY